MSGTQASTIAGGTSGGDAADKDSGSVKGKLQQAASFVSAGYSSAEASVKQSVAEKQDADAAVLSPTDKDKEIHRGADLTHVARTIRLASGALSSWSLPELTVGLKYIRRQHRLRRAAVSHRDLGDEELVPVAAVFKRIPPKVEEQGQDAAAQEAVEQETKAAEEAGAELAAGGYDSDASSVGAAAAAEMVVKKGLYDIDNKDNKTNAKVRSYTQKDVVKDEAVVNMFRYWLPFAEAAYRSDEAEVLSLLPISGDDILKRRAESDLLRPAYYVLIDRSSRSLVIGIRGTKSASDAMTDLSTATENYPPMPEIAIPPNVAKTHGKDADGQDESSLHCHHGMVQAAVWFWKHVRPLLLETLQKESHKSHIDRIVVVGHSLGAGIASILAMMLHPDQEIRRALRCEDSQQKDVTNNKKQKMLLQQPVMCVAFAPPACMSRAMCEASRGIVHSVVLGWDLVPRFSISSLTTLRDEVVNYDWASDLHADVQKWKLVQKTNEAAEYLRKVALENKVDVKIAAATDAISEALNDASKNEYVKKAKQTAEDVGSAAFGALSRMAMKVKVACTLDGYDRRCDGDAGDDDREKKQQGEEEMQVKLSTLPLFTPGSIYHVVQSHRLLTEAGKTAKDETTGWVMVQSDLDKFAYVELQVGIVSHHLLDSYLKALKHTVV